MPQADQRRGLQAGGAGEVAGRLVWPGLPHGDRSAQHPPVDLLGRQTSRLGVGRGGSLELTPRVQHEAELAKRGSRLRLLECGLLSRADLSPGVWRVAVDRQVRPGRRRCRLQRQRCREREGAGKQHHGKHYTTTRGRRRPNDQRRRGPCPVDLPGAKKARPASRPTGRSSPSGESLENEAQPELHAPRGASGEVRPDAHEVRVGQAGDRVAPLRVVEHVGRLGAELDAVACRSETPGTARSRGSS